MAQLLSRDQSSLLEVRTEASSPSGSPLSSAAQGCHLESLRSACGPVTVGGPGEFRVTPAGWCEGGKWRPRFSHAGMRGNGNCWGDFGLDSFPWDPESTS